MRNITTFTKHTNVICVFNNFLLTICKIQLIDFFNFSLKVLTRNRDLIKQSIENGGCEKTF